MKRILLSVTTFAVFLVYYVLIMGIVPSPVSYSSKDVSFPLFCLLCAVPSCLMLGFTHGREALEASGLRRSPSRGFIYALLCVSPMLLFVLLFGEWNRELSAWYLINTTLVAGFFEEFFFRGILLGQLYRYARWGFVPAILVASVIFGLGHIYQGHDLLSSLLAGLVTGLGGLLFGWVYVETGYNLWCGIFLHALMNLSWIAFSLADNAATASWGLNIARLLTVALAIALVILYKKKKGIPYQITKETLWRNPSVTGN